MKKIICLLIILSAFSCINKSKQTQVVDEKSKTELKLETQSLKQLQDSFNNTGNYAYMTKYILKIDSLIKKYPDHKGFVQTRNMMFEMYGDSLNLK